MIKATFTTSAGKHGLIIGLSKRNTERLLEGKPIHFTMAEIGNPDIDSIVIVAGETEAKILSDLQTNFDMHDASVNPQTEH